MYLANDLNDVILILACRNHPGLKFDGPEIKFLSPVKHLSRIHT